MKAAMILPRKKLTNAVKAFQFTLGVTLLLGVMFGIGMCVEATSKSSDEVSTHIIHVTAQEQIEAGETFIVKIPAQALKESLEDEKIPLNIFIPQ